LEGVDSFPGEEGVVFIQAMLSDSLRQIHAGFGRVLANLVAINSPLYELPRWRPHCTVATGVAAELMQRVSSLAESAQRPGTARVTSICGVRYRPATLQFRQTLSVAE
jgi:hypothetical protein